MDTIEQLNAAIWGDPNYFVLLDFAVIDTELFDLPTASIGEYLYLVQFQAAGLEYPKSEPIGVYYYAGIRRFIWKNKFYSEYDLSYRPNMDRAAELLMETRDKDEALNYRKLLDFLKYYGRAPAPNIDSTYDEVLANPELRVRKYIRAIYEIE